MDQFLDKPLSPSRANQFRDCELLYRYRTIDKLPERPSPAAVRGTLVHNVLESMFGMEALSRTPDNVVALLPEALASMLAENPSIVYAVESTLEWSPEAAVMETQPTPSPESVASFIEIATGLVEAYFALEFPQELNPTALEMKVNTRLDSGVEVHGIIDRFETNGGGAIRISDYKTGKAPDARWEDKSWFQMLFYALITWRDKGVIPAELRLIFLGNSRILTKSPTETELLKTENTINEIARDIKEAVMTGNFKPRKSGLCQFCTHQDICTVFGGKILPLPYTPIER